jgi:hypothetical protein
MPGKPKGTVRGHKTTASQQRLMGLARGMQEGTVPKSYSSQGAKIASTIGPKDLHNIAQRPKGGYRKKKGK